MTMICFFSWLQTTDKMASSSKSKLQATKHYGTNWFLKDPVEYDLSPSDQNMIRKLFNGLNLKKKYI